MTSAQAQKAERPAGTGRSEQDTIAETQGRYSFLKEVATSEARTIPFVPGQEVEVDHGWIGRRKGKVAELQKAIPVQWPTGTTEREELLDAWHCIAMQVLHVAGASFRFMAVIERLIDKKTGVITFTNDALAKLAGGCSKRTISRDVSMYESLCLISGTRTRRRQPDDTLIEVRKLRLSFPAILPDGVFMPEDRRQ
jgi:hypothetical protein